MTDRQPEGTTSGGGHVPSPLAASPHHDAFDHVLRLPIHTSILHRLPWLIIGLAGGIFAAGIIGSFEEILSRYFVLAAFIPLVVYIADAIGTQVEAFVIRDFAFARKFSFVRYFFRQAIIVAILGSILGAFLFGVTYLMYGSISISIVLGIALFAASLSALVSGLVIPFLFRKVLADPANASGPIATIIQDVLSVTIYMTVAVLLLP